MATKWCDNGGFSVPWLDWACADVAGALASMAQPKPIDRVRLSKTQIERLKAAAEAPQSCQAWGYGRQASTYASLWGLGLVANPVKVTRKVETRGSGASRIRVTVFRPVHVRGVWVATEAGRAALRKVRADD
jgi:hypothetical protein